MADIVLDDIVKRYPDGFEAVKNLNLTIADGEFMILVGPSGLRKVDGAQHDRRARGHLLGRVANRAARSSTGSRRATATSRWCSRATRSTRT